MIAFAGLIAAAGLIAHPERAAAALVADPPGGPAPALVADKDGRFIAGRGHRGELGAGGLGTRETPR